jgi:hypothetical protein
MTPTPQATPRTDALISSGPFSGPKDVIELWDRAVDTCRELEIALSAAEARVKEVERDAARYRWLREPSNLDGPRMLAVSDPDELDAAIDAALAGKQEEGR